MRFISSLDCEGGGTSALEILDGIAPCSSSQDYFIAYSTFPNVLELFVVMEDRRYPRSAAHPAIAIGGLRNRGAVAGSRRIHCKYVVLRRTAHTVLWPKMQSTWQAYKGRRWWKVLRSTLLVRCYSALWFSSAKKPRII